MQKCEPEHLRLGKAGEDLAAAFLLERGYIILARNWHARHLELDIICEKNNEIFFIEVKTRSSRNRDDGYGALTPKKKRNILNAARYWLSINGRWTSLCHFGLICLYNNQQSFQLEYYKDAFDSSLSLDRGNANWQPW